VSDGVSRSLVVLAEDNADLRQLLADGLARVGFAVVEAENGAVLVEKVAQLAADPRASRDLALIVTDVRMPTMDGITAVQSLRALGVSTPVIFMTAYGDASSKSSAEKLKSRWIDKPVGLNSLRVAVAEALGLAPLVPREAS
jgi:CheY-like chemotaxis protein